MEAQANVSGKGILNFQQGSQQFSLTRHAPSQACSPFIERYWIVRWDLRGQPPYRQVVLTHPNVNLVFEQGLTRVYGIKRTSEIRIVEGAGHVLGVKFKPGGFYPFWKQDMSELTETSIDFRDAFGEELGTLEADILAERDDEAMIARAESFFRRILPERDAFAEEAARIVQAIECDRELTKVDDVAVRFGMNKRSLQRLFNRYVGVSPKWVIQRYRLHEAAEQMERGEVADWAKLSLELGYYDQAHLIKAFKAIVGKSPEQYSKAVSR